MGVDDRVMVVPDEVGVAFAAVDLPDDLSARGELPDCAALVVGDVDVPCAVDHQVEDGEELCLPGPVTAELAEEVSVRGEDLDAGVAAVGDVDLPVRAD